MNSSLVLLIAVGIISNIITWRLQQVAVSHSARPLTSPRMAVMEYAPQYRTACWILMMTLAALTIAVIYRYGQNMGEVRVFFSATLVLLACGGLLLIEVLTRRVVLTEDAIGSLGRLSRNAIQWSSIESIRFNRWSRMIIVQGVNGERLRINPSLSGVGFLEFMASEKLEKGCYEAAFRELRVYLPKQKPSR